MINTIVRGIPSTLSHVDNCRPLKYLVRSYQRYHNAYVTSVWRLKEAEHDFEWAKNRPEYHHYIKDSDKNEVMYQIWDDNHNMASTYLWMTNDREIGALHQQVCMEIINGEFWDGDFALP